MFARWGRVLAVVVGFLFMLAGLGWARGWFMPAEEYRTAIGEHRTIHLKDGTTVELNTASRLAVNFTTHDRFFELIEGEAMFDVGRDQRALKIRVGPALFEDIGTRFVIERGEKIELTVLQGKVRVLPASPSREGSRAQPVEVGAHQVIVLPAQRYESPSEIRTLTTREIADKTAWREGRLAFNGEPLSEVIAQFNRYNRRQLEIADPSIADREIGGSMTATPVESFVEVIEALGIANPETPLADDDAPIRLVGVNHRSEPFQHAGHAAIHYREHVATNRWSSHGRLLVRVEKVTVVRRHPPPGPTRRRVFVCVGI